MKPTNFGLFTIPPIRWLLSVEPAVKQAVADFLAEKREGNTVEVVGPPSLENMMDVNSGAAKRHELPVVCLKLKKMKHHLTGEDGIEVSCSDLDRELIVKWHNQAKLRSAMPGLTH